MTGRSGYQKDHATAARLFAHLPPDHRLVLCGTGTDRLGFRRRFARASGLSPADIATRVRFLGAVRDIRPVLHGADLFLMTSRYEGMPIAALEAFEAGLPLATTDIPGMVEIVAAHPLATTFPRDLPVDAEIRVAARIADLIHARRSDPATCDRMIRTAWRQRFSFPVWQQGMVTLAEQMLQGAKSRTGREPTIPAP